MTFTKFRGISEDDIETAASTLTEQEWHDLQTGFLDQIAIDLAEWMDLLGIDEDRTDSVVIFWRLYRLADRRLPESVRTTTGV